MLKTCALVGLLMLAAPIGLAGSASAAMQVPVSSAVLAGEGQVTPVTFWAQPYPYRYVPRHRSCPRVRVETPYGWYWDRVCAVSGEPVLRRVY